MQVAGLLHIALDRSDGALALPQPDERGRIEHVPRGRPVLGQHVSALADALHAPRRRTCVENNDHVLAPIFGQPRPASRLGRAGRPRASLLHRDAPGVNTVLSKPGGAVAARPRRGALVASTPAASTARRVAGGGKSDGSSKSTSDAAIATGAPESRDTPRSFGCFGHLRY